MYEICGFANIATAIAIRISTFFNCFTYLYNFTPRCMLSGTCPLTYFIYNDIIWLQFSIENKLLKLKFSKRPGNPVLSETYWTGLRRSAIVPSIQGTIGGQSSIPSVGLARKSSRKTFMKPRRYWRYQTRKAKSPLYLI